MTDEQTEDRPWQPGDAWVAWAASPVCARVPAGVTGLEPITAPAFERANPRAKGSATFPERLGDLQTRLIMLRKGPSILSANLSSWAHREVPSGTPRFVRTADANFVGVHHAIAEINALVDDEGRPRARERETALLAVLRWLGQDHAWHQPAFARSKGRRYPTVVLCRLSETAGAIDPGEITRRLRFATDRASVGAVHDYAAVTGDWATVDAARDRARVWFGS